METMIFVCLSSKYCKLSLFRGSCYHKNKPGYCAGCVFPLKQLPKEWKKIFEKRLLKEKSLLNN